MLATPTQQRLMLAIAAEFGEMRALLEKLAEDLIGDEEMIVKHYGKLQQFDLVIQHIDESARLLERLAHGIPPFEAIDKIGLSRFQSSLSKAIGG